MFFSRYKKHYFIFMLSRVFVRYYQCIVFCILFLFLTVHLSLASDLIPDSLVYIDTDRKNEYIILIEKETQKMFIYNHQDEFKEVKRFKCSSGEIPGSKSQSGDRKTPEGIYFFTNSYKKRDLTPIYGTRAFPIDYPNFMDRFAGKNGSAIWVHGTNKKLKPRDTNGCIAMVNRDIEKLDKYISLNRTPIVIQKKIDYISPHESKKMVKRIKDFIFNHEKSIITTDKDTYFTPYTYFKYFVPGWWDIWERLRSEIFDQYSELNLEIKNILITKQEKIYVALFDQFLKLGKPKKENKQKDELQNNQYIGTKKIFLVEQNSDFKIIGEDYQKSPFLKNKKLSEDPYINYEGNNYPLVTALNYLVGSIQAYEKISVMIDGWLEAWSSKDINRYGEYYANDFRAKGKDKEAWLRYKQRLNKHYEFIKVTYKELKIKPGKLKTKVSFEQIYASSAYKAKGIKNLILKRVGGKWKIYRETWKKL